MDDLTSEVVAFRDAREWGQHHTPEHLATGIAIEAGELLEVFPVGQTVAIGLCL